MSSDHTDYYSECSLKACIRWYTTFNPYLDLDSCPFPFCRSISSVLTCPQTFPIRVGGSDTLGILQLCSVPITRIDQVEEADQYTLPAPADFHVHLRQGTLSELVTPHVRKYVTRTAAF